MRGIISNCADRAAHDAVRLTCSALLVDLKVGPGGCEACAALCLSLVRYSAAPCFPGDQVLIDEPVCNSNLVI